MILTLKKGVNTKLSEHFSSDEFDCKCSHSECTTTTIDTTLIEKLEAFRTERGRPVYLDSGYRCKRHNKETDGAPDSQHPKGTAADIQTDRDHADKDYELVCKYFNGIGDGRKHDFIHVDVRSNKAKWSYP